ncbi:uncharacterized protein LOC135152808 [Daucus carota subsp. sativus]|uniref:uncharacterized protein LOC135152808 n=1 Tax=Daucus carota subsp. sativus TaxID=79200 RepID=UPI003082C828
MKQFMPLLVSCNQAAFIRGRKLGDLVLLAQALCKDYHRNLGAPRIAFKLNLSKAFDSLNWEFLFKLMVVLGFPPQFILWVKACISGAMISLKINGALEGYFNCKSGLKQGDPLSPYLFVLAMEALTACLNLKIEEGPFKFHSKTKDAGISHLIFADDVMLFCHGDADSVKSMMDGVNLFSSISGLCLNPAKCVVFFGNVPSAVQDFTIATSRFNRGALPVNYLGLPLISGKLFLRECLPLISKIRGKFEAWNGKYISQAGRAQLIKSVIFGMQGHWSHFLFLPKLVLKRIQSDMAKFLWKGDLVGSCHFKVSWKHCCYRKSEGGLGFKELLGWNQSAVWLQVWRIIKCSDDSLWIHWIHKCFLKNRAFWTMKIPYNCPWSLRKILNARPHFSGHIRYQVGRESNFLLWHDPWSDNRNMLDRFGCRAMSSLESTSLAPLHTIIRDGTWNLGNSNDHVVIEMRQICATTTIHDRDEILWNGSSYKNLRINDIWDVLRTPGLPPSWYNFVWCRFMVPKFAFTTWLIVQERLLTKDRMINFRMRTTSSCVLCGVADESHTHLFCHCTYIRSIFASWNHGITSVWDDLKSGRIFTGQISSIEKESSFLFISSVFYSVWRERNLRVHEGGTHNSWASLLVNIKRDVKDKLASSARFRKCVHRDTTLVLNLY